MITEQILIQILNILEKRILTEEELALIDRLSTTIETIHRQDIVFEMWKLENLISLFNTLRKKRKPLTPSELKRLKALEKVLSEKYQSETK